MMSHESYCRLHEALEHLGKLNFETRCNAFLNILVERVRNSIAEALKADKPKENDR